MPPHVSVIIPLHNASATLAEAVASARVASAGPVQLVLVESGSTDGSGELAQSLARPGDHVMTAPRPGASAARNTGLEVAEGAWIQFLDADDWLEPGAIDAKLAALSHPRTLAVGSRREIPSGVEIPPLPRPGENPAALLLRLWWGEDRPHLIQTGQWLLGRSLAHSIGPWNESLICNNDGEYFARAALAAEAVVPVPASISGWRRQPPDRSLSTRQDPAAWRSRLRSWEMSFAHFQRLAPPESQRDPRFTRARQAQYSEIVLGASPFAPAVASAARHHLELLGLPWLPSPFLSRKGRWLCRLLGPERYRRLSVARSSRNDPS